MKFRKWLCFGLSLVFLFLLSSCGNQQSVTGIEGMYQLQHMEKQTVSLPQELLNDTLVYLDLQEGGSGVLHLKENSGNFNWSLSNDKVFLKADLWEAQGTVQGSSLLLSFPNDSKVIFSKVSDPGPDLNAANEVIAENAFLGDWYGWLKIESEKSGFPNSWYDCCAKIEEIDGNQFLLVLWDEDGSMTDPLAEVTMRIRPDGGAVSQNGYFCYADIKEGEWSLLSPHLSTPSVIQLMNCFHDAAGETFTYSFYLHPWGTRWLDSDESSVSDFLPFYYYDWYLPLIENNEEMPDSIPWENLEKLRSSPDAGD